MNERCTMPGAFALERKVRNCAGGWFSGLSNPVRVRYEVDWGDPLGSAEPLVRFFYRDRRLTTWFFGVKPVLDGEFDRTFAVPVRIMIDVGESGSDVEGHMFAVPVSPGPWLQYLGPVRHEAPRDYGPHDGRRAAIDAVLHYMYGRPDVAVERLITELGGEPWMKR